MRDRRVVGNSSIGLSITCVTQVVLRRGTVRCCLSRNDGPVDVQNVTSVLVRCVSGCNTRPCSDCRSPGSVGCGALYQGIRRLYSTTVSRGSKFKGLGSSLSGLFSRRVNCVPTGRIRVLNTRCAPLRFTRDMYCPRRCMSLADFARRPCHRCFTLRVPSGHRRSSCLGLPLSRVVLRVRGTVRGNRPMY